MKSSYALTKLGVGSTGLIAFFLLGGAASGASAKAPAPLDGPVAEQFVQRTQRYADLREAAIGKLPQLEETTSPTEINAREKSVAAAIRSQRASAKRGDVFGSAGVPIQALVREDWKRRTNAERKSAWADLPRISAPAVNAPYPPALPLATFPPELLTLLPELPKVVEYRFAGPHLILRDVEANLVVDVLPDVLPGPGATAGSPRLGQDANQ